MRLLALQDEAEQADGLLVPVLLDEVVDQGLEELVGLVELVLEDLDPAQLDPGVDVEGMAGDDLREDLLGLLRVPGLEVDVAEDVEELDAAGRRRDLPFQELDGPLRLSLLLEDLDQSDQAADVAGPDAQGLAEDLLGGLELALFDADVRAPVELLQGRVDVAEGPVQAGQRPTRLVVLAVELDDLLIEDGGLGGLALPGQPAGDSPVVELGFGDEALLGVEVGQLERVIRVRCR